MIGTLIRLNDGDNILGVVCGYCDDIESSGQLITEVVWSDDGQPTTERFEELGEDSKSYDFLDKQGQWRNIAYNFYKFKQLMEVLCK